MTDEKKISIRAYAEMIGVDEKAVRKARDAGKLGDGYDPDTRKIIPSLADLAWGNTQKIARPKPGVGRDKVIEKLEGKEGGGAVDPDPGIGLFAEKPLSEIDTAEILGSIKITSKLSASEAMRQREILSLIMDMKELQEKEGILVKRELVEKALFNAGIELKRSLLDIPSRIAADLMACKFEIDAIKLMTDELVKVLDIYGKLKPNAFTAS